MQKSAIKSGFLLSSFDIRGTTDLYQNGKSHLGKEQMVQQFCLKTQYTCAAEKHEGGKEWQKTALERKPTYTVAGNLEIQALTIKATEVALHRHLLASAEVRRMHGHWGDQHFEGPGLHHSLRPLCTEPQFPVLWQDDWNLGIDDKPKRTTQKYSVENIHKSSWKNSC